MSWDLSLCDSAQHMLDERPRGVGHWRVPDLLTSDQTAVDCLSNRLPYSAPVDRSGLDHVKDSAHGTSKPETWPVLYVNRRHVGIVKHENSGNLAVAPKTRWNRHVKLRRIQIGQIVKTERGVVTVDAFDYLIPIPRPQGPESKIGAISHWKQSESVDTAVLAEPVPCLHVIGMRVFGESGSLSLFGGEEALLLFGDFEKPSRHFIVRSGHNTILQFLCSIKQNAPPGNRLDLSAAPA
jgi:hypothetical protein